MCGSVEGRRRGQAAGHDRVMLMLPAAAGRAPLPLPLRYRLRVLMGGSWAAPCSGPRTLGWSAGPHNRSPRPVARCEVALDPGPSWPHEARANSRGQPLLTLWSDDVGPRLTWTQGWGRGRPPWPWRWSWGWLRHSWESGAVATPDRRGSDFSAGRIREGCALRWVGSCYIGFSLRPVICCPLQFNSG